MLNVLALIIPLGLAGAISPVLLTEQTVLLAGPGGRRAGQAFALAAELVLFAFTAALVLFGRSIALPRKPHLSASADLAVGVLLILLALFLRMRRPKEKTAQDEERSSRRVTDTRGAFAFGMFSMATNFTTLAFAVPAAKEIAAGHVDIAERMILTLAFVALAAIPAWVPLAMTRVAPQTAQRVLAGLEGFIQRNGRRASVVLLAGFGAYLAIRGITRLA